MQNSDLAKYTRYSEDSLRAVQAELLDCAKRAPNSSLKAVYRKSASHDACSRMPMSMSIAHDLNCRQIRISQSSLSRTALSWFSHAKVSEVALLPLPDAL